MRLEFQGKVTLKVEVDGDTINLGSGAGAKVPFARGERYFIEIKSTARDARVPWRVDLIEQ